jgi:hypothetical protein
VITGHIAASYLAMGVLRDKRIFWLLGAAFACDAVDVLLALAKVCSAYGMYSHSLPALGLIAPTAMVVCWIVTRDRRFAYAGLALALVHLPLDWVTGRKALWPYGPLVGLDLYQQTWLDFAIEAPLILLAWIWTRSRLGPDKGLLSKGAIVVLLSFQCLSNVLGQFKVNAPISSQTPSCKASFFDHQRRS